jgi:hypothetical protein
MDKENVYKINTNTIDNKNILWYDNPHVLFDNLTIFLPYTYLTPIEKKNSLVRLSIYVTIFIFISKQKNIWYYIPLLIFLSNFLITIEKMDITKNINNNEPICQKPTIVNPFMNYTIGDLINNPNRKTACNYIDVKEEVNNNFNNNINKNEENSIELIDTSKIWGNFTSNRNFYTMPNTKIVNDQDQFAKWCFGDSGSCKSEGNDCLKVRDPTYHRGRITKV